MTRVRIIAGCIVLGLLLSLPANATYHVAGSFCSACGTPTAQNQLFDDGLHNDGAAGDGIWGVDVVVDQPAGPYSWLIGSTVPEWGWPGSTFPACPCLQTGYAKLWTTGPGDVIHFTLVLGGGSWLPNQSVATDHATPTPSPFVVGIDFDLDPRYGPPHMTAPMTRTGSIWEAVVLIPIASYHAYAFYSSGVLFLLTYSANCLACEPPDPGVTPWFSTTVPNSYVRFQFDEARGRMLHEVLGPTPAMNYSWGRIKSLYR